MNLEVARCKAAARAIVLPPSVARRMRDGQDAQRTLGSARWMTIAATVQGSRALMDYAVRRSSGINLYIPRSIMRPRKMFGVFHVYHQLIYQVQFQ